jgi:hypothetical protein
MLSEVPISYVRDVADLVGTYLSLRSRGESASHDGEMIANLGQRLKKPALRWSLLPGYTRRTLLGAIPAETVRLVSL